MYFCSFRIWMAILAVGASLAATMGQANAIAIKRVESNSGITALLVEDYTLPLISLAYSFRGGTTQDQPKKAGTAQLMSALIDEGAGELDSAAFRAKLEELGIGFGFSSSRDFLAGSLRMVRDDRETAFEMLKLALNQPRFDQEALERMRDAIRKGIIRSRTSPRAAASKALRESIFAEHSYSEPAGGDEESIDMITRADLVAMHRNLFARETLVVGVVGAISEVELIAALDNVFGDLPFDSTTSLPSDIDPVLGKSIAIDLPTPNANISLVFQGLKRDHPDFFAAHLLNHIMGGGTFSSRLYKELREKRGLVYSVSSGMAALQHSAYLSVGTSTRADNQAETIRLIKGVIDDVVKNGVTAEELEAAKKYVIGSYAIANLDTSGKIARVLVAIQNQSLGIDYIEKRKQLIERVTVEDVNRIAVKLLSIKPTQVVVGPPSQ